MSISGPFGLDINFQIIMLVWVSSLDLAFLFFYVFSRSSDCFSLGWPMRDDGEFFKSTRDIVQVLFIPLSFSYQIS